MRGSGRRLCLLGRIARSAKGFTVLQSAITTLNSTDTPPAAELLRSLSPLSWEHINLTGNYT